VSETQAFDERWELLTRLNQAIMVSRLHELSNVAVEDAVRDLESSLSGAITRWSFVSIKSDADAEVLFFNDKPLRAKRQIASTLESILKLLETLGIGELRLSRSIPAVQIRALLRIMNVKIDPEAEPQKTCHDLADALEKGGFRGIVDVLSFEQAAIQAVKKTIKVEKDVLVRLAYARTLALLREYTRNMRDEELRRYFWQKLQRAVQGITSLAIEAPRDLLALSRVRGAEDGDFNHAINTCVLSLMLAVKVGLPRAQLVHVGLGALLHGLGRFRTAEEIVHKAPEQRSDEEKREYGRHPYRAIGELLAMRRLDEPALSSGMIAFLFEAGSDFPAVRAPHPLHPFAQIVGICEAYDRMTSSRPGQTAILPDQAINLLLSGQPRSYDHTLLKLFTGLLGLFPPGTAVRLDSGEIAVVVHPNPDHPAKPVVAVVRDAKGRDVDGDIIDLAADGPARKNILESVDPLSTGVKIPEYLRG
jgi:HD-GYP domain-containing protein (c-di-GMP phosphodiesterase class II)